jgi:hypothetical protein
MRSKWAALFATVLALAACGAEPPRVVPDRPGVFVLGVDGLDPVILDRLIEEGRMPHFAALARDGSYQRLGTSNPPQSPVAWSNFVTPAATASSTSSIATRRPISRFRPPRRRSTIPAARSSSSAG